MFSWAKHFLEYLNGAQDLPPAGIRCGLNSIWWGLWWGVLLVCIVLFCGQSSKFIYIDF